jgi:hypothetical protein
MERAMGELISLEEGMVRAVEALQTSPDGAELGDESIEQHFGDLDTIIDDFAMNMENVLAESRLVLKQNEMARELVTLRLAKDRNGILKVGLMIQLGTLVLGANSAVSGYFGTHTDAVVCSHALVLIA